MLIGLSAGTLLLGNGTILGAAGITRSVLQQSPKTTLFPSSNDTGNGWKVHFLAAFCLVSDLYHRSSSNGNRDNSSSGGGDYDFVVSTTGYAVAGFLVGLGTTMGNGCTSGHGICGLARFSKRSLSAVLAFMATGMLTATICDPDCPLAPWLRETLVERQQTNANTTATVEVVSKWIGSALTGVLVTASGYGALFAANKGDGGNKKDDGAQQQQQQQTQALRSDTVVAWVSGGLFSLGLCLSGMVERKHIIGFLDAKGLGRGTWDPTLLFVMVGGLFVSTLSYQFVPGYNVLLKNAPALKKPLSSSSYRVPTNTTIDAKLLMGAALFGLGWGIGGVCPGPGVYLAATGHASIVSVWWPCFWLGSLLG